jgi:hypothetical protein
MGLFVHAALIAFGILWCREMFGRWRSDLDELRHTSEPSTRNALLALWLATAFIAYWLTGTIVGVLRGLAEARALFA